MPIYEYQCTSCEHKLEALQKISDEALTECPACHKDDLRKLISAASFRLKGGGWYETDFKTGKKKQLADSGSSESASSSSSGGSSKPKSNDGNKKDNKGSKKGDSAPAA